VRSPSDVLRLLVGGALVLVGVILATVADRTVGGVQADLSRPCQPRRGWSKSSSASPR
jgi:hypothetical protein